MIFGTGVDIIGIERVLRACESESFLNKVYTAAEQAQAGEDQRRLAGDFAVKEAVSKCLGTGIGAFKLTDVEVLRLDSGRPYVTLYGDALELFKSLDLSAIHVSISNDQGMAVAVAIAEKRDKS